MQVPARRAVGRLSLSSIVPTGRAYLATLLPSPDRARHRGPGCLSRWDQRSDQKDTLGAVDARASYAQATRLFGIQPKTIGFLKLGEKWGLGTMQVDRLNPRQVIL